MTIRVIYTVREVIVRDYRVTDYLSDDFDYEREYMHEFEEGQKIRDFIKEPDDEEATIEITKEDSVIEILHKEMASGKNRAKLLKQVTSKKNKKGSLSELNPWVEKFYSDLNNRGER